MIFWVPPDLFPDQRPFVDWLDANGCPHWIHERSPIVRIGPVVGYIALCRKDRVDRLWIWRDRAVPIGPRFLRITKELDGTRRPRHRLVPGRLGSR
jgi:hypothetical protein